MFAIACCQSSIPSCRAAIFASADGAAIAWIEPFNCVATSLAFPVSFVIVANPATSSLSDTPAVLAIGATVPISAESSCTSSFHCLFALKNKSEICSKFARSIPYVAAADESPLNTIVESAPLAIAAFVTVSSTIGIFARSTPACATLTASCAILIEDSPVSSEIFLIDFASASYCCGVQSVTTFICTIASWNLKASAVALFINPAIC